MNMLLCMVSRNLKIFLKDKANIFFSLLCPLIVLALYVLFLGKIQVDNLLFEFFIVLVSRLKNPFEKLPHVFSMIRFVTLLNTKSATWSMAAPAVSL